MAQRRGGGNAELATHRGRGYVSGGKRGNMMSGWAECGAALAMLLLSHAVPVRPAVKGAVIARTGARSFTLPCSALSLAVLVV